jgi:hypothetical protein
MSTEEEKKEAMRKLDRLAKKFSESAGVSYSEGFLKAIKQEPKLFEKYSNAPTKTYEAARQDKHRQLTFSEGTHLDRAHRANSARMRELYPGYSQDRINQAILAEGGDAARIFKSLVGVVYQDDIEYFQSKGLLPRE